MTAAASNDNNYDLFAVQMEGLTAADLDSPSLKGVRRVIGVIAVKGEKEGKVVVAAVEVTEEEEGGEAEEEEEKKDLNFLQRSLTPSWMHTMPRCVLMMHTITVLYVFSLYCKHVWMI